MLLKIVVLLHTNIFPVKGIKDTTEILFTSVYGYVAALAVPEVVGVFAFRLVVTQLTPNCILDNHGVLSEKEKPRAFTPGAVL